MPAGYVIDRHGVFVSSGHNSGEYSFRPDDLVYAENHDSEIIDAPDEVVEKWLGKAQSGDLKSLERIRCWAYFNANRYFESKVPQEKSLTTVDVGDMTSRFFVDFEKIWPRARSITRYSRTLMKCTLTRYIGAKKRRREVSLWSPLASDAELVADDGQARVESGGFNDWSDTEWNQYEAVLLAFADSDALTRRIVAARMSTPPTPYEDLAIQFGCTRTSLRMRMSRFYRLARSCFESDCAKRHRTRALRPYCSNELLRRPWLE